MRNDRHIPKDPSRQSAGGHASRLVDWLKNNRRFWLVLYWPIFVAAFFAIERIVTADYYVSYLPMDDLIPFCEYFVVFYCLWYPFLAAAGLWLLFRDGENFKYYMLFIIIGFSSSLLICLLFPNGQDLRPEDFPRTNLFTRVVGLLYRADTNTNVLPSMHVVGCVAACCALLRSQTVSRAAKAAAVLLALLIIASTVLIKQHSILDIYAGFALCVPVQLVVCWLWKRKRKAG